MRVGTPQLQASAQQAELELRQLREENEHLRRELLSGSQGECGPGQGAGSGATSSRPPLSNIPSLEERALLRQLKEVTDRQREELRAHNRDILQRSQETEAVRVGWGGAGRLHRAGLPRPSALRPPASPFVPPPVAGAAAAPPTGEYRVAAQAGRCANPAACRTRP